MAVGLERLSYHNLPLRAALQTHIMLALFYSQQLRTAYHCQAASVPTCAYWMVLAGERQGPRTNWQGRKLTSFLVEHHYSWFPAAKPGNFFVLE